MQTGMSGDLEEVTDSPKTLIIDKELNRPNINIAAFRRLVSLGLDLLRRKTIHSFAGLTG